MFRIVVTRGREAEREECQGYYSLFLTPSFVEEFYYVSRTYNLADLVPMRRFSMRKPTAHPFRIAGADGSEKPVIEIRFRQVKFLSFRFFNPIEQKVELVH
jgi:hypothetical protein